jgi:hypothetical protein
VAAAPLQRLRKLAQHHPRQLLVAGRRRGLATPGASAGAGTCPSPTPRLWGQVLLQQLLPSVAAQVLRQDVGQRGGAQEVVEGVLGAP